MSGRSVNSWGLGRPGLLLSRSFVRTQVLRRREHWRRVRAHAGMLACACVPACACCLSTQRLSRSHHSVNQRSIGPCFVFMTLCKCTHSTERPEHTCAGTSAVHTHSTDACAHTCMRAQTAQDVRVRTHAQLHARTHSSTRKRTHVHAQARVCTCACVRVCMRACVCADDGIRSSASCSARLSRVRSLARTSRHECLLACPHTCLDIPTTAERSVKLGVAVSMCVLAQKGEGRALLRPMRKGDGFTAHAQEGELADARAWVRGGGLARRRTVKETGPPHRLDVCAWTRSSVRWRSRW